MNTENCPLAVIKRDENETYEDFKKRRHETNKMIRHFCKGALFHDTDANGTYDIGMRKAKEKNRDIKREKVKRYKAIKAGKILRVMHNISDEKELVEMLGKDINEE